MTTSPLRLASLLVALTAAVPPLPLQAAAAPDERRVEPTAQRRGENTQEVDRFTRTIRVGQSGELELSNISGDITVTGTGGDEIRIAVTKRSRARSTEEAQRQLSLVEVDILERGGRVEVRTRYRSGGERNIRVSVEFEVMVPAPTRVAVQSISGDITIGDVQGEVRAQTVSGDLDLRAIPRLASGKSVSGDVVLADVAAEGDLSVSSVSGDLEARGLQARSLDLSTVSGDLRLTQVQSDRVALKSVSGTLEYAGPLARSGRYDFSSHSGDVRLDLEGDTGFELEARSFSGSIDSEFPITLRGVGQEPDAGGQRGSRRNRTIVGVYGDGGAVLEVTTFSGSVIIRRR